MNPSNTNKGIREPLLDHESQIKTTEFNNDPVIVVAQDAHIQDAVRRNRRLSFVCGIAAGVIFELAVLALALSSYIKIRPEVAQVEDKASFLEWLIDSNADVFSIILLSCLGFFLLCTRILRSSYLKIIHYVDSETFFAMGYMCACILLTQTTTAVR